MIKIASEKFITKNTYTKKNKDYKNVTFCSKNEDFGTSDSNIYNSEMNSKNQTLYQQIKEKIKNTDKLDVDLPKDEKIRSFSLKNLFSGFKIRYWFKDGGAKDFYCNDSGKIVIQSEIISKQAKSHDKIAAKLNDCKVAELDNKEVSKVLSKISKILK